MLREVRSLRIDGWECVIMEHVGEGERFDFVVCHRGGRRAREVLIPHTAFVECDARLFEKYGLPRYVAKRLADACMVLRIR